jgi:hypothetical protein
MPDSYADQFEAMLYALEQEERRKAEGSIRRHEESVETCREPRGDSLSPRATPPAP